MRESEITPSISTAPDEIIWAMLEREFADQLSDLKQLAFEPPPNFTTFRQRRRIQDGSVRSGGNGLLVETRPTTNVNEIIEYRNQALRLAEEIAPMLTARKLGPELLQYWGAFNFAYALVTHDWYVGKQDKRELESAKKRYEDALSSKAKRWIARELLHRMGQRVSRPEAERSLAHALIALLNQKPFPSAYDKEEIGSFLSEKRLSSTFRGEAAFPRSEMQKMAAAGWEGLPPPLFDGGV